MSARYFRDGKVCCFAGDGATTTAWSWFAQLGRHGALTDPDYVSTASAPDRL